MKKLTPLHALALTAALFLSACAQPNTSGSVYNSSQALQAQHVEMGTITSVRAVELRNMDGNADRAIGVIAGGLAGAMIGDQFGAGKGNTVMTGIGAVAGAAAGDAIAQNANRSLAQEWTVRLDHGRTIAVIQNDPNLYVGQHVRVLDNGHQTRLAY